MQMRMHVTLLFIFSCAFYWFIMFRILTTHGGSKFKKYTNINTRRVENTLEENTKRVLSESGSPEWRTVDARMIVIVYNRPDSLKKCLDSLNAAFYDNDTVHIDIWIDKSKEGVIDEKTKEVAENFVFIHGTKTVHLHKEHVGIYGQWIDTWYPDEHSKEIAVILEDDMTVAPCFYRWTKKAHQMYDKRKDIAGYALQSDPKCAHVNCGAKYVNVSQEHPVYLYMRHSTWGYSPHAKTWRQFVDWFHEIKNKTARFRPLVDGLHSTRWWKMSEKRGKTHTMWEQWHTYFINKHKLYTLYSNLKPDYVLATNRQERGLHFKHQHHVVSERRLWKQNCDTNKLKFPQKPIKLSWDMQIAN